MKKYYFALLLFFFCALKAQCLTTTDNFYINEFTIAPGEQKTIELNVLNTQPYKSFQVNVYLPEGLSFVFDEDEEAYVFPTNRIPRTWIYYQTDIVADGSLLVSAYKSRPSNKDLEIGDGAVFEFDVVAANDFEGGIVYCKKSVLTDADNASNYGPDTQCFASKPVSLAEMVSGGKVDGVYAISEALTCVFISEDGTTLWAKDGNGFALKDQPPYVATEDQKIYDTAGDFDQSNWVEITLTNPVSAEDRASLQGHLITEVRGLLLNKSNPQLSLNKPPVGGAVSEYKPNVYNPANFVTQEAYFLMPPKPQEYAHIKWGIYQDGVLYVPQKEGNHNSLDLNGAVSVNAEFYKGQALTNGTVYEMKAIVKKLDEPAPAPKKVAPKTSEPSNLFEIYVMEAITNEIITGVENIQVSKTDDGRYYNLLGQPVTNPSPGIYIHNGKKVVVNR